MQPRFAPAVKEKQPETKAVGKVSYKIKLDLQIIGNEDTVIFEGLIFHFF